MPAITCYLAELKVPLGAPLGDTLEIAGVSAADYLKQGSQLGDGSAAIDLAIDTSRRHSLSAQPGIGVDDAELQDALASLLGAGGTAHGSLGLILADVYRPMPDAYGFMFDLDEHQPAFGPRQGCAVFLDKIETVIKAANKSDADFRDLVAYTAVHEIGHAFNLWHVDNAPSFMTTYPGADFQQACTFVPEEMAYLRHAVDASNASYVLPGGSAFGERGPIGDSGGGQPYLVAKPLPLALQIGLSHESFWQFEPVELDVQLSVTDPTSAALDIPNVIDPGYPHFVIWITRPDGERHRYRPSVRFCGSPLRLEVTPERPFRRDISLFRQSGGYMFNAAGRHLVQAELRLGPGQVIQSNIVECEVRRADGDSSSYAALRALLEDRQAMDLMRYKSRAPTRTAYSRIEQFLASGGDTATVAALHYCLGRAILGAHDSELSAERARDLYARARHHLEIAAACPSLGDHRRMKATRLLERAPR